LLCSTTIISHNIRLLCAALWLSALFVFGFCECMSAAAHYWGFSAAIVSIFPQIVLIMRMFGVSEFQLLCQGDYGACVLVCGMLAVYGYELRVLTSSYLSIFLESIMKRLYYSLSVNWIINYLQQPVPFHFILWYIWSHSYVKRSPRRHRIVAKNCTLAHLSGDPNEFLASDVVISQELSEAKPPWERHFTRTIPRETHPVQATQSLLTPRKAQTLQTVLNLQSNWRDIQKLVAATYVLLIVFL